MAGSIKRSDVLKLWDIKEDKDNRSTVFSIKFLKKDGELIFLPKAIACGLSANMKSNRLRGAHEVNDKGERQGHPYPVNIDFIMEFNGRRVSL